MIITADRVITGDAKNPPLDLALRIVGDKITDLAPPPCAQRSVSR